MEKYPGKSMGIIFFNLKIMTVTKRDNNNKNFNLCRRLVPRPILLQRAAY